MDNNIIIIRKALWWIAWACSFGEMVFFPSLANLIGVIVTLLSLWLFNKFVFRQDVMQECPFSFIAFLQLFLFMYLALPCTLLDGNEMSHDLFNPISTYIWQLLYFFLASLAFEWARLFSQRHRGVQNLLDRIGFFNTPSMSQLWLLALIGWMPKLLLLNSQYSGDEMYQSGAGTLTMFSVFIYAPVVALFMPLLGGTEISRATKNIVYGYAVFLSIMMIATNSRSQMIAVWFVVLFGFLIKYFYKGGTSSLLSPKRLTIYVIAFFIVTGPVSDMAFAMLLARSDRNELSYTGLLSRTWEIYNDKEYMNKMKAIADAEEKQEASMFSTEWNESYVSNIFLQRVTNYRVVDATIYHAQKAGFANAAMWDEFLMRLEYMFPEPVIKTFDPLFKKNQYAYSAMDRLYNVSHNGSLGGFKVGGDVGLGLATFGYLYFPLMVVVYFLLFYIFNNMVYMRNGARIFPLLIMLMVYDYVFRKFDVANGIQKHINYILYGSYVSIIILQVVINFTHTLFPSKSGGNHMMTPPNNEFEQISE